MIIFKFKMNLIFKGKESYIPTLNDYEFRIEDIYQRIHNHVGEVYSLGGPHDLHAKGRKLDGSLIREAGPLACDWTFA